MPGGNGTGPMDNGPMTGRARGSCAGYSVSGDMDCIPGQRFGLGFGKGRGVSRGGGWGRGNMFCATGLPGWQRAGMGYGGPYGAVPFRQAVSPQQELDMLRNQSEYFKDALEGIKKRMGELEAANK